MSDADLKALAEYEFQAAYDAGEKLPDASAWGAGVGVSKTTVYRWVSHIINRDKDERKAVVWRLAKLGFTQERIGKMLGVDRRTVGLDANNSHLGKIGTDLGANWSDQHIADW